MPDIFHEITVQGTRDQVYFNLTEQEGLAEWWTTHTSAAPVVGSDASFAFNRGEVTFTMRIEDLRPPTSVRWHCIGGPPEWLGTNIEWDLEPEGEDATTIKFRHLGFRSTDGGLGMYSYQWAGYLWSLKELIENAEGHPYTDPPFP